MADPARDIIILGFRQTLYTKRGPRKTDGSPGDVIQENAPEYWVKYCNRNMPQSTATEERLRHMDPANFTENGGAETAGEKMAFLQYRWDQIAPAFEAWQSGQVMPEYGIPLAAWSAINADQVKMLHASGLKSVEDVRDLTENQIGKIKLPNVRDLKKMAALYLDGLGSAKLAEENAARDAEISGLKEQLAAAMALLEEQAELNAVTHGNKRPAKAEQQAA